MTWRAGNKYASEYYYIMQFQKNQVHYTIFLNIPLDEKKRTAYFSSPEIALLCRQGSSCALLEDHCEEGLDHEQYIKPETSCLYVSDIALYPVIERHIASAFCLTDT